MRILTALLGFWFAFTGVAFAASETGPGEFVVALDNGLVSIDADDVPLGDVLAEIARRSGISVVFNPASEQRVTSLHIRDLAFEKALKRLLKGVAPGHIVVRGKGEGSYAGVAEVIVMGAHPYALAHQSGIAQALGDVRPLVEALPSTDVSEDVRQWLLDAAVPADSELVDALTSQDAEALKRFLEEVRSTAVTSEHLVETLRGRVKDFEVPPTAAAH